MNNLGLVCGLNIAGLAVCITFSTFALYAHNNVLPYLYFIFAVCVIIAHTYLYCTRCIYYGKDCYMFGGRVAKRFFKERKEGSLDPDDAIAASLWLLLALFPIPFLLYYEDVLLAALCMLFFWAFFLAHSRTACKICDNKWCALNKRRD